MISSIWINNLAVIEDLQLSLEPGLNVFTGETGAGKSIIVDAVETALGGRARLDLLRAGAEKALIEVEFDISNHSSVQAALEELEFEPSDTLVITRTLHRSGKSQIRINGRPASVSMLRKVTQNLVDIHGQHEHQLLLNPAHHLQVLDSFGGEPLASLKQQVAKLYSELQQLTGEIQRLGGNPQERAKTVEELKWQIAEIDSVSASDEEERELLNQRFLLLNAEKLLKAVAETVQLLYTGEHGNPAAMDLLGKALTAVQQAASIDPNLRPSAENLSSLIASLSDFCREMLRYQSTLEFDPKALEAIENRLETITRLKRKYGPSLQDVMEFRKRAAYQLEQFEKSEELLKGAVARRSELIEVMRTRSLELSSLRKKTAEHLSSQVTAVLNSLGMEQAKFDVVVEPAIDRFTPNGIDRVEFMVSCNPGEPLKPLDHVASGGELARIMLAIKSILASTDMVSCLIFDEIDAGVGGNAAVNLANKLKEVSKTHQVLCVTHLAQVASVADAHFYVYKKIVSQRAQTFVQRLDEDEKMREIARMMAGGTPTRAGLDHARELIERSRCR